MKIELELTEKEAKLIHTFIRRSCFEQYARNMDEAGASKEETESKAYATIEAFAGIRDAIEEGFAKKG
jgi:hypothetical protein